MSFNNRYFAAAALVFALVFTGFLTVVVGFAINRPGSSRADAVQAAPIDRDSDALRAQLNGVYTPEFAFNFDSVGDPFADKSNLSTQHFNAPVGGAPNGMLVAPATAPTASGRTPMMPNYPNGRAGLPMMPSNQPNAPLDVDEVRAGGKTATVPLDQPKPPDTKEILRERNRRLRLGLNVGGVLEAYSIDDLRPYGTVGTGDNNYVKLISTSTKDRLRVHLGEHFRDGVISRVTDEGVEFRRDNGKTVFSRWLKTTKSESGDDSAVIRVARP